jgi:hypothetical protein
MLQTLAPGLFGRDHCSSCFQNYTISSSTSSTQKASLGERPSVNSAAVAKRVPIHICPHVGWVSIQAK